MPVFLALSKLILKQNIDILVINLYEAQNRYIIKGAYVLPDQGSEGLLSPFLRKRRIKAALPFIYGQVLDIGCGSGELAKYLPIDCYTGVDVDQESLNIAKNKYADHQFQQELPSGNQQFDTIVSLAVIEHVDNPEAFLLNLIEYLTTDQHSRIVLTSPHPITNQLHYFGSRVKLFSRTGNEEHEKLLNYSDFLHLAEVCGLYLKGYQRFLFGMNQLVVYQKEGSSL